MISGSTLAMVRMKEAFDKINIPIKTIGRDNQMACLAKGPISLILLAPYSWAIIGVTKKRTPPIPIMTGNHKLPASIMPACTSVE